MIKKIAKLFRGYFLGRTNVVVLKLLPPLRKLRFCVCVCISVE